MPLTLSEPPVPSWLYLEQEMMDLPDINFDRNIDLISGELAFLYKYWQEKHKTSIAPSRRDILPEDIASCLNHVALIEPVFKQDQIESFYLQSTGRELERSFGIKNRSVLSDLDLPRAHKKRLHLRFEKSWNAARPLRHESTFVLPTQTLTIEGLSLPLTNRFGDYQYMLMGLISLVGYST